MTFDELYSLMIDEHLSYDVKKIIYEQAEKIQDLEDSSVDREIICSENLHESIDSIYDELDKIKRDFFGYIENISNSIDELKNIKE